MYNVPMLGSNISLMLNTLMYKSDNKNNEHYFLLYDEVNQHYNCITDIKQFLGVRCFCFKCLKSFLKKETYDKHECCEDLKKKTVNKKNEGKMIKELSHYLTKAYTKGSKGEIENKLNTLKNSDKAVEEILHPKYIIYDFETDTHTDIHIPNHVEIDILKIDETQSHKYENCLINSFGFNGYGCDEKFCDWLFTTENSNSTVIAHNGAGYDNKFILQYCLNKGLNPSSFIRQGSRITYMNFNRFKIRFIDSYHFFNEPLKNLSKTYDIDTLKGYFPHHFNIPKNQNYIGTIPDVKYFGINNMMPDDYKIFKPWYDMQKDIIDWSFKKEMVTYCRADVVLLSKAVLKFRKNFKDDLDTDPFRYTTLASLCMSTYINNLMPEKTIVGNNTDKKDSLVCREWLSYLDNKNIVREIPITVSNDDGSCNIHKNKIGKKICQEYNLKRPFTVDGFDYKNKKAYLFQGCYWHGCRTCHPENIIKYNKSMEQVNLLQHNDIEVVQMWECEWNKIKANLNNKALLEQDAKNQNIVVRDAFFGGRTEGFKSYHKCKEGEKIFYYDIVSL